MIALCFEELPYQSLITKLQELARENVGELTIPSEYQRKFGPALVALADFEEVKGIN